jgi:hypothetical protein
MYILVSPHNNHRDCTYYIFIVIYVVFFSLFVFAYVPVFVSIFPCVYFYNLLLD